MSPFGPDYLSNEVLLTNIWNKKVPLFSLTRTDRQNFEIRQVSDRKQIKICLINQVDTIATATAPLPALRVVTGPPQTPFKASWI